MVAAEAAAVRANAAIKNCHVWRIQMINETSVAINNLHLDSERGVSRRCRRPTRLRGCPLATARPMRIDFAPKIGALISVITNDKHASASNAAVNNYDNAVSEQQCQTKLN